MFRLHLGFSERHAFAGHYGGLSTSPEKVAASRRNGRLGGRPIKHGFYSKFPFATSAERKPKHPATSAERKPKHPATSAERKPKHPRSKNV